MGYFILKFRHNDGGKSNCWKQNSPEQKTFYGWSPGAPSMNLSNGKKKS